MAQYRKSIFDLGSGPGESVQDYAAQERIAAQRNVIQQQIAQQRAQQAEADRALRLALGQQQAGMTREGWARSDEQARTGKADALALETLRGENAMEREQARQAHAEALQRALLDAQGQAAGRTEKKAQDREQRAIERWKTSEKGALERYKSTNELRKTQADAKARTELASMEQERKAAVGMARGALHEKVAALEQLGAAEGMGDESGYNAMLRDILMDADAKAEALDEPALAEEIKRLLMEQLKRQQAPLNLPEAAGNLPWPISALTDYLDPTGATREFSADRAKRAALGDMSGLLPALEASPEDYADPWQRLMELPLRAQKAITSSPEDRAYIEQILSGGSPPPPPPAPLPPRSQGMWWPGQ